MKRIFLFHGCMEKKKKNLITLYETALQGIKRIFFLFLFHGGMKRKTILLIPYNLI